MLSSADRVVIHRVFLQTVAKYPSAWTALTPATPVAVAIVVAPAHVDVGIGTEFPPGVVLVAGRTLFEAASYAPSAVRSTMPEGYVAEWWAVLRWTSFSSRSFVSWWPRNATATHGTMQSMGHPEVLPVIDVLDYPSKPSQVDERPFALAMLQDITIDRQPDPETDDE